MGEKKKLPDIHQKFKQVPQHRPAALNHEGRGLCSFVHVMLLSCREVPVLMVVVLAWMQW